MADVQHAISKFRAIERRRGDLHQLYLARQDELMESRRAINKLVHNLSQAREQRNQNEAHNNRLQAQLEAERAKFRRIEASRDEIAAEMDPLKKIENSCRNFLESGGVSLESLESGYPVATRRVNDTGEDTGAGSFKAAMGWGGGNG